MLIYQPTPLLHRINGNNLPSMSDFRDVVKGPAYTGPDDKTILDLVSDYGTQRGCFLSAITKQIGPATAAWTETLDEKLARLVNEGKLKEFTKLNQRYLEIKGKIEAN